MLEVGGFYVRSPEGHLDLMHFPLKSSQVIKVQYEVIERLYKVIKRLFKVIIILLKVI